MRFQISQPLKTLIWIVVALIIVAVGLIILYVSGFFPYPEVFAFLSGLVAGIFGILIGFSLDRVSEAEKDNQTKDVFLNFIQEELITIKNRISPQKNEILLLYTDAWDSMISSGLMRLLNAKQVLQLSRVYKEIKETSFEAERIRLNRDEWESTPNSDAEKKRVYGKFAYNLNKHYERMANLSNLIDEVLKEEWLTPKQIS
jgi:hypothetical protein